VSPVEVCFSPVNATMSPARDGTGIDARERQVAVREGLQFEGERAEGLVDAGSARDRRARRGIEALDGGRVERRGQPLHHGVEQRLDADVLLRDAAQDGDQRTGEDARAQRLRSHFARDFTPLEERAQHVVVLFGQGFE
jgi:hypothetical protein